MPVPYHKIAVNVLAETDNPAVMWGDAGLLDMIYYRKHGTDTRKHPYERWKSVLDGLSKSPGPFIAKQTKLPSGKWVRYFELHQESAPAENDGR